jgi:hypothetical protein
LKIYAFLLVTAMGLSGCTDVANYFSKMAIANLPASVLPPGFLVEIAGKPIPIQGFDKCSSHDPAMTAIFGPAPNSGENTCILLNKERTKVPVLVALPSGLAREEWRIVRDSGVSETGRHYYRITLRRPDGSLVIPVKT